VRASRAEIARAFHGFAHVYVCVHVRARSAHNSARDSRMTENRLDPPRRLCSFGNPATRAFARVPA